MKRLFLVLCMVLSVTKANATVNFDNIMKSVVVVESLSNNQALSLGTGFYFDKHLIVTNYHVIKGYNTFKVQTYNEFGSINATLVGYDKYTDLAILSTEELAPRTISITLQRAILGEEVYVIGHPFGYKFTISKGVISSMDRYDISYPFINYIQTDANVQSGSSGSPVINHKGDIVGIIKSTVNSSSSAGISLALTMPLIFDSIQKIKEQKIVKRPSLMFVADKNTNIPLAEKNLTLSQQNLTSQVHIYSNKTVETSTSLHSINGIIVKSVDEANSIIQSYMPGETIDIVYRHNGVLVSHKVELKTLN